MANSILKGVVDDCTTGCEEGRKLDYGPGALAQRMAGHRSIPKPEVRRSNSFIGNYQFLFFKYQEKKGPGTIP